MIPLVSAEKTQYALLKKFSAICKNKFDVPLDIVVDSKNNTYTIDKDHCLQKISNNCTVLFRLNISSSTGLLALDSSDNLLSLRSLGLDDYAINKFAPSGAKLPNINQSDINATTYSPKGVAVDSSDNIYVANDGFFKHAGIKKFNSNGKFLNNYTSYAINLTSGETDRKKIRNPGGIDVDPFDNIYVVDNRPFSFFSPPILKFSSNGTFIKYNIINNQTTGTGINHVPKDIATDSRGNLYVLDTLPISCFSAFSSNGPSFMILHWGECAKIF